MKQMLLNSLTYQTSPGGATSGVMAFHLDFTGQSSNDSQEIASVLAGMHRHALGSTPVKKVLFKGNFTRDNALDILTIAMSLKGSRFILSALTTDLIYHQWFKEIQYLIAETSNSLWSGLEVQEIWYNLPDGDFPEPFTVPDITNSPNFYVKPDPDLDNQVVLDFMKSSKIPWNLWSPPSREIAELVRWEV
jgi:hypothetical protein